MYDKILVPLDGSGLAECVLPHVESIAGGCGAKNVTFIRIVEPFYIPEYIYASIVGAIAPEEVDAENKTRAKKYLDKIVTNISLNGAKPKVEVVMGKPADVLATYASKNKFDLIIIATHGRSGVSRWVWGSVADRVLRSACAPVLMVRAPGCVPGI